MTYEEALREILRRALEIKGGIRLVGGPRAVADDLGSVAAKALGLGDEVTRLEHLLHPRLKNKAVEAGLFSLPKHQTVSASSIIARLLPS
jgi:hypothetical protein